MSTLTENLLPNVVKRRQSYGKPYLISANDVGPVRQLTFATLENASNRAAHHLQDRLRNHDRFIYMGPNDERYLIWVLGAMKAEKCVSIVDLPVCHINRSGKLTKL